MVPEPVYYFDRQWKGVSVKIIKRDGREVPFDRRKIVAVIQAANRDVPEDAVPEERIHTIAETIESKYLPAGRAVHVEEIQDQVMDALAKDGHYKLLRHYSEYRLQHALLQKSYTADFLTKKMVPNEGELPQYYVENHHEGIIDREVWDIVQMEVKRRKEMGPKYSGISIFSTRIKCGECGCWYGSKVWHSTDKYRRTIWQCNGKYKKRIKCSSPALTEDQIKEVFMDALAELADDKDEVIGALDETRRTYFETESLESRIEEIVQERETVVALIKAENDDNARAVRDQEKKGARIDRLLKRIEKLDEEHAAIEEQIQQRAAGDAETRIFIKTLKAIEGTVTEFDDVLWTVLLDSITVYSPEDIRVRFKGGREVVVGMRSKQKEKQTG